MKKQTKKQTKNMILLHESYWRDSLNPYPGRRICVWAPASARRHSCAKFEEDTDLEWEQEKLQRYADKAEYFADLAQEYS